MAHTWKESASTTSGIKWLDNGGVDCIFQAAHARKQLRGDVGTSMTKSRVAEKVLLPNHILSTKLLELVPMSTKNLQRCLPIMRRKTHLKTHQQSLSRALYKTRSENNSSHRSCYKVCKRYQGMNSEQYFQLVLTVEFRPPTESPAHV